MHYQEHKSTSTFFKKAEKQLQKKLPFVLYRKPSDDVIHGIFQKDASVITVKDFTETGFLFAPFSDATKTILLRPDQLLYTEIIGEGTSEQKAPVKLPVMLEERSRYIGLVSKGIELLKKGTLKKVVLSRKIEVPCNRKPLAVFWDLLEAYSAAFCYYWYHPAVGLWIGATPELFMNFNGNEFRTISLAATQRVVPGKEPVWGVKEIQEQEMVTQYIEAALKNKVKNLNVSEAQNSKAGQLWHLRSDIKAQIDSDKTKEVIKALHPTSAVCGMPLKEAQTFIGENEGYNRKFYTGYLGELNLPSVSNVQLYVNLRCMEVSEGKALIYVGGGITADSDPEKEWQETVDKSYTMLNIL